MERIEGYVSKKNIKRWVENYGSLEAGDPIDDGTVVVSNSGPKNADGVSGGRVNKIMLDHALQQLRRELPLSYRCIEYQWLRPILQREALHMLGISRDIFINRAEQGITFLYLAINGEAADEKQQQDVKRAAPGKLLAAILSDRGDT